MLVWREHVCTVRRSPESPKAITSSVVTEVPVTSEKPVEAVEATWEPAWKRKNLQKELEELGEIEAHAIAIRWLILVCWEGEGERHGGWKRSNWVKSKKNWSLAGVLWSHWRFSWFAPGKVFRIWRKNTRELMWMQRLLLWCWSWKAGAAALHVFLASLCVDHYCRLPTNMQHRFLLDLVKPFLGILPGTNQHKHVKWSSNHWFWEKSIPFLHWILDRRFSSNLSSDWSSRGFFGHEAMTFLCEMLRFRCLSQWLWLVN